MNKLMARIVAVVLAVMMLGTVSFAADVEATATENAIKATGLDEAQGMYTVKAKNANGEFIAMYQGTTAPTSIAIDPEKVEAGETITVEYGGVTGGHVTQPVVVNGTEKFDVLVAKNEIEVGGVTYTDVAWASKTFTPDTGKKTSKVGFNLVSSAGSADGVDVEHTVAITGPGSVTFDVIILQVPVGVTINATPYIVY